jgi:hypothetical protein
LSKIGGIDRQADLQQIYTKSDRSEEGGGLWDHRLRMQGDAKDVLLLAVVAGSA